MSFTDTFLHGEFPTMSESETGLDRPAIGDELIAVRGTVVISFLPRGSQIDYFLRANRSAQLLALKRNPN